MKNLLTLAAACAIVGAASAQSTQVDPSVVPGLTPGYAPVIGARATTACDNFNRAALGSDWTPLGGAPVIIGNAFADATGANAYAQHTTASVAVGSAVISFDVPDSPANGTYGAAVHGLGGSTNLYTKLQSGGGSTYGNIGFYSGFNGAGYGSGFTAIAAVTGGIVTCYLTNSNDTMNVEIDTDRDGVADASYTNSGASAYSAGAGMGVGVGSWGGWNASPTFGSVDSWELNGGCAPQGPTLTMTGPCPGTKQLSMTGMTAGGIVAITYGLGGSWTNTSPTCNGLTLDLVPIPAIPVLTVADGAGNAAYTGNAPGGCGNIRVQAVDVATCVKTNYEVL